MRTNKLLVEGLHVSPSGPLVRWVIQTLACWNGSKHVNGDFGQTASGWRDTEVVSASMRKEYMMTLVRACPSCNSLLAPWCYVMPQGDVIPVENWVPAAKSEPLVKLADSAVRFTPKKSESPSAFAVAERNVCAVIKSDDSDGSGRDGPQRPGGPAKLRRCVDSWVEKLGLSAVSNDGAGNCMFEALGQASAKAQDSDGRSHSQDGCCGKDDGP